MANSNEANENGQNNSPIPPQNVFHIGSVYHHSNGPLTIGQSNGNNYIEATHVQPPTVRPPSTGNTNFGTPSTDNGLKLLERFKKSKKNTREFLQPYSPHLAQNTADSKLFMEYLFAMKCITSVQKEEAEAKLNYDRNNFLYTNISKRDAMDRCIVALEKSGNDEIISDLLQVPK